MLIKLGNNNILKKVNVFSCYFEISLATVYYTVKIVEINKKHSIIIEEYYKMDTYYRKFYIASDKSSHADHLRKFHEASPEGVSPTMAM